MDMRATVIIVILLGAVVSMFVFSPRGKQQWATEPLIREAQRTKGNGSAMPGAMAYSQAAHDLFDVVKFNDTVTIPASGKFLVRFDDLYPGKRLFGNCTFTDRTKIGSYMPMLENDDDHVLLQAPAGHRVEYLCMWRVPKIQGGKPNA